MYDSESHPEARRATVIERRKYRIGGVGFFVAWGALIARYVIEPFGGWQNAVLFALTTPILLSGVYIILFSMRLGFVRVYSDGVAMPLRTTKQVLSGIKENFVPRRQVRGVDLGSGTPSILVDSPVLRGYSRLIMRKLVGDLGGFARALSSASISYADDGKRTAR